jgi:hypothetical protein
MANAMEAGRQHVEQETPHELADVEAHDFALVITALPIVLPAETDVGLVEIEQAAVGDRIGLVIDGLLSTGLHDRRGIGNCPAMFGRRNVV